MNAFTTTTERDGMAGTAHAVVFRLGEDGWRVKPVRVAAGAAR